MFIRIFQHSEYSIQCGEACPQLGVLGSKESIAGLSISYYCLIYRYYMANVLLTEGATVACASLPSPPSECMVDALRKAMTSDKLRILHQFYSLQGPSVDVDRDELSKILKRERQIYKSKQS